MSGAGERPRSSRGLFATATVASVRAALSEEARIAGAALLSSLAVRAGPYELEELVS